LSDLVGFTYASWSADGAADDFVQRLVVAGRQYSARTGGGEATIFVILDGENAWEHYDGQGRPFLRALYGRLTSHPELVTVTMSEATSGATEVLPSIFPGSWINSDFYIWIGHPDDHRAWTQLAEARRALESPPPGLPEESLGRAREELLIAEGSDWFWWYGDDHSSAHDLEFDELFRRHVRNVYRALDKPIPEELFVTNITTRPSAAEIHPPTGFIQPTLDGEVTSYFEWIGAGCAEGAEAVGAMHQVAEGQGVLALVEFGFDLHSLFIRVDGRRAMRDVLRHGLDLGVNFLTPAGTRVVVRADRDGTLAHLMTRAATGAWGVQECSGIRVAVGSVVEIEIPFRCLGLKTSDPLAFLVTLNRGATLVQQHPAHQPVELLVPDVQFASLNWTA
jgi:hypothetical protein